MAEQEQQQQQASKKQRTIQVKIGNQAARAMTPDQAADYLKRVGWGQQRELKLTFDNGSTSTVSLPSNSKSSESSPRSDGLPCSEKEMKALMVREGVPYYRSHCHCCSRQCPQLEHVCRSYGTPDEYGTSK